MIDSSRIIENNKLIAEFMGWVFNKHGIEQNTSHPTPNTPISGVHYKDFNGFSFYWDWLMPVVEKIESLGYYTMINKWSSVYRINNSQDRKSIVTIHGKSKIENTYRVCVEFIKWFNTQSK